MGRDRAILQTVSELIRICRQLQKPLVIDADGLFLLTQDTTLVKDYQGVILTPNAIEFSRLFGNSLDKLDSTIEKLGQGVTVLEKVKNLISESNEFYDWRWYFPFKIFVTQGPNDQIYDTYLNDKIECPSGGSGRRCGGQGDILGGVLSTFYFWAIDANEPTPATVACYAASVLAKACNQYAFQKKGRSMTASDMIEEIHNVFEDHFEYKKD